MYLQVKSGIYFILLSAIVHYLLDLFLYLGYGYMAPSLWSWSWSTIEWKYYAVPQQRQPKSSS